MDQAFYQGWCQNLETAYKFTVGQGFRWHQGGFDQDAFYLVWKNNSAQISVITAILEQAGVNFLAGSTLAVGRLPL